MAYYANSCPTKKRFPLLPNLRQGKALKMLTKPFLNSHKITLDFGAPYWGVLRYLGATHKGIDFSMPSGTPLYASGDGTVVRIQSRHVINGNSINIRYGNVVVFLCHLERVVVKLGQIVRQGQLIAYSDNTGASTGPHLHIGTWRANATPCDLGYWCNPRNFIDFGIEMTAAPAVTGNIYVVQKGDTLSGIAAKYYSNSARWPKIYNANKGLIKNPNLIRPGMRLNIPK